MTTVTSGDPGVTEERAVSGKAASKRANALAERLEQGARVFAKVGRELAII